MTVMHKESAFKLGRNALNVKRKP